MAGGPAPYLDYTALPEERRDFANQLISQHWSNADMENIAIDYAANNLVTAHYTEIKEQRLRTIQATLEAVHSRLTVEINHWTHRYEKLMLDSLWHSLDVRAHHKLLPPLCVVPAVQKTRPLPLSTRPFGCRLWSRRRHGCGFR